MFSDIVYLFVYKFRLAYAVVLSLISDADEKLKAVDEFTSEICFELDDELMQEENGK